MEWQPEEQAWQSYINFELRYKEVQRTRSIYERFVTIHPKVITWIRFARFEQKHNGIDNARAIYEQAVDFFGDDNMDVGLLIAFAKFEEAQKEVNFAYFLDMQMMQSKIVASVFLCVTQVHDAHNATLSITMHPCVPFLRLIMSSTCH